MADAKKCGNDARDFSTHKLFRCQEREGMTHAGVVCHRGRIWWPNGRPDINTNYRPARKVVAQAVAA